MFLYGRDSLAAAKDTYIHYVLQDRVNGSRVPVLAGAVFISVTVEMIRYCLRSVAEGVRPVKHLSNHGSLSLADCEIMDLAFPLVHPTGHDQLIPIGARAARKMALLRQNVQTVGCADGGFLALAVRLPKTDVVQQPIRMGLNPLLPLLGGPYPDLVIDQPLNDKRRFIGNTSNAVKHKHKENIKLFLNRILLDCLYLVSVFGPYLMAGNALLLKLAHDGPVLLLRELPAANTLHGNICLVVRVMIELLRCRYPVKAQYSGALLNMRGHIEQPSGFFIKTITCDSACFTHTNIALS